MCTTVEAVVLVCIRVKVQPPPAVPAERAVDVHLPLSAVFYRQAAPARPRSGMGKVLYPIPSPCFLLRRVQAFHLQRLPRNDPGEDHLPVVLCRAEVAQALGVIHEQRISLAG